MRGVEVFNGYVDSHKMNHFKMKKKNIILPVTFSEKGSEIVSL